MPQTQDLTILPVLTRLAGCIETTYTQREFGKPCFFGIVAGNAVDPSHIGEDGGWMAWVRMGEIAVASTTQPQKCRVPLVVDVEVGYLTCYPASPEGEPLTVEQNLAVAADVHAGMAMLRSAILCCEDWPKHPETGVVTEFNLTRWAPLGPFGLVVGGAWYLTIEV